MKKLIARIDFKELSVMALLVRLFFVGFAHFPVLFGTLAGLYGVAVVVKVAGMIASSIRSKLSRQ
jgi:hypothetical protein